MFKDSILELVRFGTSGELVLIVANFPKFVFSQDFMSHFQNVQTAVANASQAAAEAAKQNAKEVYAKASKMKLNIQVKAPLINMPKHSRSYEAMQLDLGFLSIENHCTDVVLEEDERSPAVIDDMKILLKDVKFSTVLLSGNLDGKFFLFKYIVWIFGTKETLIKFSAN